MKYRISDPNFSEVDKKLRKDFYMDVSNNLDVTFRKLFDDDIYWDGILKVLCSDLWSQFRQFRDPF